MKKILRLRHRKKISSIPTTTIASSIWFSAPSPPWIDLPTDVTANILHRLGPEEILRSAQFVCATWWKVCKDPSMWRVIHMIDHPGNEHLEIFRYLATIKDRSYFIPVAMCRRAVERSQGTLIDISIGYFCTEVLLTRISVSCRSSRLKRLTIASPRITSRRVVSALGGELEELRLFCKPNYYAFEDMETIGICCPRLNTFVFNSQWCMFPEPPPKEADDRCALAIAKNMPNLRHLEIVGNTFTLKGLRAILDGCPRLESLFLRRSRVVGVEAAGDYLRKRCSERIKDVRLPCDSAWLDDYESVDEEDDRQEGDRYRVVHIAAINEDAEMNCRTGTLIFKDQLAA